MKKLITIILFLFLLPIVTLSQYADNKTRFDQLKPMPLMAEIKAITASGGFQLAHATVVHGNYLYVGERIDNAQYASIARIIKYDINTMTEVSAYEVGANLDVESMAYDSINSRLYATRYNSSQLEILSIDPSTMTIYGSAHVYSGVPPGESPSIVTDGTYIYGVTYTDPTMIFKIRLSDWVLVTTNIWTSRERGHATKINTRTGQMFATTIPVSPSTNPYFAKISLTDLTYSEVSIGTYVKKATDDFAMVDTGGEIYCFIGGEYAVANYGGVRVKVSDLSLYGYPMKTTYALDSFGDNIYSSAIDGTIQGFKRGYPNNIWTYNTNGYLLNELVTDKYGRVLCTNFDGYSEAKGFVMDLVLVGLNDNASTSTGTSPVTSVFGRTGGVVAVSGDYNASQVTNAAATNVANTFSESQLISTSLSPYLDIRNTGASTYGGGFRIADENNSQRITFGYNNFTNEIYWYGQYDDPMKIILYNVERFRFKTNGVFETINLSVLPSASRYGFGGFFSYNNLPYFINSSGTTTQLGAGGGSMIYPSGSGIAVVNTGTSWGTTIPIPGGTGTFLRGDGTWSTPAGATNYWTYSGSNLYPNNTTDNVVIGATSQSSDYKVTIVGGNRGVYSSAPIFAIFGQGTSGGIGVTGASDYGFGLQGTSTTGVAGRFSVSPVSNDSYNNILQLNMLPSNSGATIGTGGYINFSAKNSIDALHEYGQFGMKTTNITNGSTSSQFTWSLRNSGTLAEKMYLDATGDLHANNFILTSDRRLKTNIKPITINLADSIKFVQFNMKTDLTHRQRYGVIAQDVEKIMPEVVYTDDKGRKSVGYIDLIIVRLNALELQINALKSQVKQLQDEK
jgi:hypothetical protein